MRSTRPLPIWMRSLLGGDLVPLRQWLHSRSGAMAASLSTPDLMRRATGGNDLGLLFPWHISPALFASRMGRVELRIQINAIFSDSAISRKRASMMRTRCSSRMVSIGDCALEPLMISISSWVALTPGSCQVVMTLQASGNDPAWNSLTMG